MSSLRFGCETEIASDSTPLSGTTSAFAPMAIASEPTSPSATFFESVSTSPSTTDFASETVFGSATSFNSEDFAIGGLHFVAGSLVIVFGASVDDVDGCSSALPWTL